MNLLPMVKKMVIKDAVQSLLHEGIPALFGGIERAWSPHPRIQMTAQVAVLAAAIFCTVKTIQTAKQREEGQDEKDLLYALGALAFSRLGHKDSPLPDHVRTLCMLAHLIIGGWSLHHFSR